MRSTSSVSDREAALISGFIESATAAGATVPAAITKAIAVEATIAQRQDETRQALVDVSPGAITTALADELLEAASREGIPATFGARIADAETRQRILTIEDNVLENVRNLASVKVMKAMRAHRDIIYSEHLRPVFISILDDVRALAPALRGVPVSDAEAVLRAAPKARDAATRVRDLAARFEALARSRRTLAELLGGPIVDTTGLFSQMRRPDEVWGRAWRGRHLAAGPPWPREPLAYLVWLADQDAWLPTPDEQDAAATEQLERDRKANPALAPTGGMLVGY